MPRQPDRPGPPLALVARVRELALEFCRGELRDDLTMLAVRASEPPVARAGAAKAT